MAIFLGTLLVFGLCCLALGLGAMLGGRPLEGGCGRKAPGAPRCAGCPKRGRNNELAAEGPAEDMKGESGC